MKKQLPEFKRIRPEQWEAGKTIIKPSSEDMKWITLMMCYDSQLGEGYAGTMVKERLTLSDQRKYWRMWRCAQGMISKVMDAIYDTLPYNAMKHVVDFCDNGEIAMRLRPVVHPRGGDDLTK